MGNKQFATLKHAFNSLGNYAGLHRFLVSLPRKAMKSLKAALNPRFKSFKKGVISRLDKGDARLARIDACMARIEKKFFDLVS